jgi:hypothetical protein
VVEDVVGGDRGGVVVSQFERQMGGKQSSIGLNAKSTALEVWEYFSIENGANILENKTVLVTG